MEGDLSGLYLSVFGVDLSWCVGNYLVSDENDRDVLTDSGEILVPLGDVLVGDS